MAFSSSRSPSRQSQYFKPAETRPGRNSNIFRPPLTPSGASVERDRRHSPYTPSYASMTASSANRKRPRVDSSRATVVTPYSISSSTWSKVPSTRDSILRSDCASPPPLVNTTYNLAGGLDTPSVLSTESYFDSRENNDFGFRRRWEASSDAQEVAYGTETQQMALGGDRNGKTRYANQASSQSWGSFMFGIVGGVAGKVWELCTTSAFKGFYAGGGQGYTITPSGADAMGRSEIWEDVEIPRTFERVSTPIPGQYPTDEQADSQRPAKRLQTERGSEWVFVDSQGDLPSQPSTPIPRARRKLPTTSLARPSLPARSSRPSLVPVSRIPSGGAPTAEPPVKQSPTKPMAARPSSFGHRRSASDLTPSRTTSTATPKSPLSPETQRYMVERRREERQADASIRRLNDQLKAMIKEGKQALGTRVEVLDDTDMDMELEDEGYFEAAR